MIQLTAFGLLCCAIFMQAGAISIVFLISPTGHLLIFSCSVSLVFGLRPKSMPPCCSRSCSASVWASSLSHQLGNFTQPCARTLGQHSLIFFQRLLQFLNLLWDVMLTGILCLCITVNGGQPRGEAHVMDKIFCYWMADCIVYCTAGYVWLDFSV